MAQLQMEKSTDHVAAKVKEHVLKLVKGKLAVIHGRTSLTQEAAHVTRHTLA